MGASTAYVTVTDWPGAWDVPRRMVALVEAAGLNPADAERRVRSGPPALVARMAGVAAASVAEVLRRRGVGVVVVSTEQMAEIGPPLRARRLTPLGEAGPARYSAELWGGRAVEVAMERVRLVVRARIQKVTLGEIRTQPSGPEEPSLTGRFSRRGAAGWGLGPVGQEATRETTIRVRELIELHRIDGARVRIDSSKFNFDALGGLRGLTDIENADRLALQLAVQAPHAAVDTGFAGFGGGSLVSPRDVPRTPLDRQRFPDDDPAFEFYSVMCAVRCGGKKGTGHEA